VAKGEEIPKTNPSEIENLIEQIRGTNLEPGSKEKIERLLRTEPPRVSRRLQFLRGWSHENNNKVFTGVP
jgi:hypothetical protein